MFSLEGTCYVKRVHILLNNLNSGCKVALVEAKKLTQLYSELSFRFRAVETEFGQPISAIKDNNILPTMVQLVRLSDCLSDIWKVQKEALDHYISCGNDGCRPFLKECAF